MRRLSLIVIALMLTLGFAQSVVRAEDPPASKPTSKPAKDKDAKDAIIEASDTEGLKAVVGETVTVHGKVSGSFLPKSGSVLLINFEGANRNFTVAVPKAAMEAVNAGFSGDLAEAVKGKSLNVTGEVKLYKEKPEIEVTKPEQIKIEEETDKK
jgi:hypothetical protein